MLIIQLVAQSGTVNATGGGVVAGLFFTAFMGVYLVSLAALAWRPVAQDLSARWSKRLRPLGDGGEYGDEEILGDVLEY